MKQCSGVGSRGCVHLVGGLQLLGLHLPQDVVRRAERPHLGVADLDVGRQADEPQAVAVAQEALGPQLGYGGVLPGYLLG